MPHDKLDFLPLPYKWKTMRIKKIKRRLVPSQSSSWCELPTVAPARVIKSRRL